MKYIIILTLYPLYLYSASILINFAKDENSTFSIVHLYDEQEIFCKKNLLDIDIFDIKCQFVDRIDQNIKNRENKYFYISFDQNYIIFKPKFKANLYPVTEELITNSEILKNQKQKYKHWIIIGYKENSNIFNKNDKYFINFPVTFYESELPSVGVLDLEEKPIHDAKDAKKLATIKKLYKNQKYQDVIDTCDLFLQSSSNTTFKSELELYKLRAYDKLMFLDEFQSQYIDPYESIDLAQNWLVQNPSSIYLPEVLMYITKSYLKLGLISKAKPYFEVMENEYKNSDFYYLTKLYYAQKAFSNRNKAKAIKMYKDVLYNTKSIPTAAMAALNLTDLYLILNDKKNAVDFYSKVLKAGDIFFKNNIKQNYNIAKKFAQIKEYDLAIKSVQKLIDIMNSKSENTLLEHMQKDLAYWHELRGDFDKAYQLYNSYLKKYPNGKYKEFVSKQIDKIQINFQENNETKRLNYLNKIIKNYPNDPIYEKAIIQKAKILLKQNQIDEILELKSELNKSEEGNNILKKAVIKKIDHAFKQDECIEAVAFIKEYNISSKNYNENNYYECFKRVGAYKEAFEIAKKHFNDQNINNKLHWLYKGAKVSNKIGLYKNTILLGNEVEQIAKKYNITKYLDIAYEKAEAYYSLKKYDDLMLKEVEKIEKLFKNSIKNIDIFDKVLRYAKSINNSLLIKKYAKEIIRLQKLHKISDYSPIVEFDLITILKKEKQYKEALDIGLELLYKKLNDNQKARVLYTLGELSQKLNKPKEAKEFFLKCGEIVQDNKWQKLCVENMKILSNNTQ